MPRRAPLVPYAGDTRPPQRREFSLPAPPWTLVARRIARWAAALVRLAILVVLDILSGRNELKDRALRLRGAFEWVGGSSAEIARVLSARLDLLPPPVAFTLAMVRDKADPLPVAIAISRIEAALGGPIDGTFAQLDPEPIASEYVACTWQGRLHDGRWVAVRVHRPGSDQAANADLHALGLLFSCIELLTLARPGFFRPIREEARAVLEAEYDFVAAARFQTLFRRTAKRDRIRGATATKVVHELCSADVLVTEFAHGVPYQELRDAILTDRHDVVEHLAQSEGIDATKVARNLLRTSWWGFFENLFFDAAPQSKRILCQTGGRLVFVFLPRCQGSSGRIRVLHRQVLRRMVAGDVSGAARAMVQMLSPLPFIDVHHFTKALEARLWPVLFAMRDDEAEWWDRATGNLWIALLENAAEFRVPVPADTFRIMRSTLYFDVMAARVWPEMSFLEEFVRYERAADRRTARRYRRALRDMGEQDLGEVLLARASEATDALNRVAVWADVATRNLPVEFASLSSKGAYALSVLIRLLLGAAGITAFGVAFLYSWRLGTGLPATLADVAVTALSHPVAWVVLGGLLLLSVRRILFRLNDLDTAR